MKLTTDLAIMAEGSSGGASCPRTLQELARQLSRFGEITALVGVGAGCEVETLTFAGLAERAERVAEMLAGKGLGTGEPVGIAAPNSLDWAVACLGILAAGAAAVPFDFQQSETERARLISSTGCRFLFSEGDGAGPAAARDRSVSISRVEGCESLVLVHFYEAPGGEYATAASLAPDDLALIVHTSGTAGQPKAVPLSHSNITANISGLLAAGVANPSERALLPLPLHHIYPLVVGLLLPLSGGASVVLPSGISGPELARALRLGGATVLIGVPRLYESLLAAIMAQADARGGFATWFFHRLLNLSVGLARRGGRSFGRLAFKAVRRNIAPALYRVVSGGAALDEKIEWTLIALGYDVLKGYGLSETAPILAFDRPGHAHPGAAGKPLPGVELRISKPELDGTGEIEARGPNVFSGYRNNPAATKAAFTADGWFRTGDLGQIDADGYLHVSGRSTETLVLPGGEKLDPETVEALYAAHSAIGEIAILAEGGRLAGLVVSSAAARAGGPDAAEGAVRTALASTAAQLPSYMQLSGFALTLTPLPRTQIGKLRRYLLPALYRDAEAKAESRGASLELTAADRALLADPVAQRVWEWLASRFPGRHVSLDMNLRLDLGIDSLGWVTITMDLERALGVALSEAALSQIVTVRDLVVAGSKAGPRPVTAAEEALPPKPGFFTRIGWYAFNALDRLVLRTLFRLRVEGAGYLPPHGPYLICPNHASYLDPLALDAALPWPVLRQVYWAASPDILFKSRRRRVFSRTVRALPVDPVLGVRTGLALSAAILRLGNVLVWFPEGWRSKDGNLQPFMPGIGALLLRSPAPVIPVFISGTFKAWPRHRRFPRLYPLAVRFGPPLNTQRWAGLASSADAEERIAFAIKEAVAALDSDSLEPCA